MTRLEISVKVLGELIREELENLALVKMVESGAIANMSPSVLIVAQSYVYEVVGENRYRDAVETAERIVKRQYELDAQQSQIIRNN